VDAYLRLWARIDPYKGAAFNLGGGPENAVSLRELLAYMSELLGREIDISYSDWRAGDQRYFVADTRAARAALDLSPAVPWRQGVGRARRLAARVARSPARAGAGARRIVRLLLTADAVGGVWQYATDLARALRPLGVEPVLAVLGPQPTSDQRAAAAGLELIETGLPLDWLAETQEEVRAAAQAVAELACEQRADLVQINAPALAVADFAVPVVAVAHSCLATWWEAVIGGDMPDDFRWRTELHAEGLRRADQVVAPSTSFAEATRRAYALSCEPRAVHNGRAPLPLPEVPRQLLAFTAGRLWDKGKDVRTLDQAAGLLPFPLHAAGPLPGPMATASRSITLSH
jgi:hypothetical protein